MAEQPESTDRIIGLAKVFVWPLLALLGIIIFAAPVKEQFVAGKIEKFKVGFLELNMRASDLPAVHDRKTAIALVGLPEFEVVSLLFAGKSGYSQCIGTEQSPEQFDAEYTRPFEDLAKRGLATVSQTNDADGGKCVAIDLTDQGKAADKFIKNLIAAQFKTATAQ